MMIGKVVGARWSCRVRWASIWSFWTQLVGIEKGFVRYGLMLESVVAQTKNLVQIPHFEALLREVHGTNRGTSTFIKLFRPTEQLRNGNNQPLV
jgi:hypothetical protein